MINNANIFTIATTEATQKNKPSFEKGSLCLHIVVFYCGADGGTRTPTVSRLILSQVRLPIPPHRPNQTHHQKMGAKGVKNPTGCCAFCQAHKARRLKRWPKTTLENVNAYISTSDNAEQHLTPRHNPHALSAKSCKEPF